MSWHNPHLLRSTGCDRAFWQQVRHRLTGIPHIKLPGPKHRTILDESHSRFTHEYRQPSNQAHKTIRRRRELVFDGQRRWLSLRLHSLRTPPGTHLSLGYPHDLRCPKEIRYPGAGWSPAIRSNTCRNNSRSTATSASWTDRRHPVMPPGRRKQGKQRLYSELISQPNYHQDASHLTFLRKWEDQSTSSVYWSITNRPSSAH